MNLRRQLTFVANLRFDRLTLTKHIIRFLANKREGLGKQFALKQLLQRSHSLLFHVIKNRSHPNKEHSIASRLIDFQLSTLVVLSQFPQSYHIINKFLPQDTFYSLGLTFCHFCQLLPCRSKRMTMSAKTGIKFYYPSRWAIMNYTGDCIVF